MFKVIMTAFILCANVDAASFEIDLKCDERSDRGITWDDGTKTLTCGNLKVMPQCGATVNLRMRTITCSNTGPINFYCPGGMEQVASERGAPVKYECRDKPTLDGPGNLRITITR